MKPECILIRVGEQSLKSKQVWTIFNRILIKNIRAALEGINYELKNEMNRIFIYTKNVDKSIERLQKVFGITSLSPVYVCDSKIEEMKKLSKKIFKPGKKKFAIRARRSGSHQFTSQDIAVKVGYIIPGKVDLSNPEKELFIECRQNKTYIFTEKIDGPGGLPLGSGGKIFGILNDQQDLVASWLLMKRGCEVFAVSNKKPLINKLKKWHIGQKFNIFAKIPENYDIPAIVAGEKTAENMPKTELMILRPLVGLDYKQFLTKINS
ncbi:MAG: THUMP domain-containing protein [Candidatus Aenigmarchaeota archaeon]|nr:THUMP domain-containing protein [Candidatus Aenigmarchaeota archaeon]